MIHCYQFDGLNIVLDCYSGSIHMVDEVAYDMIQWYETEPAEDVIAKAVEKHGISREDAEECIADIDDLKSAGNTSTWPRISGRRTSRSRLCVFMSHTHATSTAPTALQVRASTTVSVP